MISLIEASNYRCLRSVSRPLNPFHILVGPNASGKTTFLDAVSFLSDFICGGLDRALSNRTQNFYDLFWGRSGNGFEINIEALIPEEIQFHFDNTAKTILYELSLGIKPQTGEFGVVTELVMLKQPGLVQTGKGFYQTALDQSRLTETAGGLQLIVNRAGSEGHFGQEFKGAGGYFKFTFQDMDLRKSALNRLVSNDDDFPVTMWLKDLLVNGVQSFVLNSALIKKASPPGQTKTFKPDGSNLPWVIETLFKESPDRFNQWIGHVQTALPDIEGIRTVVRDDDRHRYLMIRYRGGLEVPSWMVSDGTLRLLALTLPAYLTDFKGIYLIEEPENGIHPRAVETVFQSLSSVYNAQILLATHSPVILSVAEAKDVLCFSKNDEGATDIVSGDQHPALRDWKGQTNLGDLFASGVLG